MKLLGGELGIQSGRAILSARCKELGLPTWFLDDQHQIVEHPSGWGPPDHWLRAPLLSKWLGRSVSAWADRQTSSTIEIFPGCWLIPVHHVDRLGSTGTIVAMALGSEALDAEQFETICSEARIDAAISRTVLAPLARYRRCDYERLVRTLRWMHGDLALADEHVESITAFSQQLSDCYEQIAHLYELSRAINHLSEPDDYVELSCTRLQKTLDFDWIAAGFVKDGRADSVLTESLIISGKLPCEPRRFIRQVTQLGADSMTEGVILTPEENTLAALVRAPVLVEPVQCMGKIVGHLIGGGKRGIDSEISSTDLQLLRATAEYIGAFINSAASYREQRTMFLGTIRAITYTIEAKDRYTRGHSERVAHLAAQLAAAYGLASDEVSTIRLAGMLHDVGKIGVSEAVLRKPGQLTDDEYEAIKRHPVIGYAILRDIGPLKSILPAVLHHHERWDGGGYPQGLAGASIPLNARILAVADTFDAMCSDRSYRSARPRTKVVEEMHRMAGTQLDPDLTATFLELSKTEYDRMIAQHLASDGSAAA